LSEKGCLDLECFGGNIPTIHISAKFNKNIDLLEELILFEIDLLNLRENTECLSEGVVLESRKGDDGDGQRSCTLIV
jgi:translation initiation factor IF-2